MVELRWVVPAETTTEAPRLQYRNWGEWPAAAGPWIDVPTVVEAVEPPKPAPTPLVAIAGVPTFQWVKRCRHPGQCIAPQCGDFCHDAEPASS